MTVRLDFYFLVAVNPHTTNHKNPRLNPCHNNKIPSQLQCQLPIIPVTMAGGFHLFPFRTQKLSLPAPMVLPGFPVGEWVVAGMIDRWTVK